MIYTFVITCEKICSKQKKKRQQRPIREKKSLTHTPKLGNNCDSFRGSNKRIAKHADDKQIYSMKRKKKHQTTNKRADTQWLV